MFGLQGDKFRLQRSGHPQLQALAHGYALAVLRHDEAAAELRVDAQLQFFRIVAQPKSLIDAGKHMRRVRIQPVDMGCATQRRGAKLRRHGTAQFRGAIAQYVVKAVMPDAADLERQ